MTPSRPAIVIVGGGPRGLLLVDRIAANIGDGVEIDVHVVDDTQIGPGRVWRTDQTRELCMNTMADAVTLFTDASVTMKVPVREGPTLPPSGAGSRSATKRGPTPRPTSAPSTCGVPLPPRPSGPRGRLRTS